MSSLPSWQLCTIKLPLAKYKYQKLQFKLFISTDIFREKTNELFNSLEYVRPYIYDLLIISNSTFEDYMNKIKK